MTFPHPCETLSLEACAVVAETLPRTTAVEWTLFRGHVRAFAVRPRKDGVRRAPNPTCLPAGVPA